MHWGRKRSAMKHCPCPFDLSERNAIVLLKLFDTCVWWAHFSQPTFWNSAIWKHKDCADYFCSTGLWHCSKLMCHLAPARQDAGSDLGVWYLPAKPVLGKCLPWGFALPGVGEEQHSHLKIWSAVGEHLLQPDSWIRVDETFAQQSRAVVVYGKRNCSLLWIWTCPSVIKNELGVCTWWLLWNKVCSFSLYLKLSTWCSLWI